MSDDIVATEHNAGIIDTVLRLAYQRSFLDQLTCRFLLLHDPFEMYKK